MKFTVLQENILKTLQDVARFVPTKPQIPILSCFYLQAKDGEVLVSATDLSVSACKSCGGKVEIVGDAAVPARPFLEYISALQPGSLEIELKTGEVIVRGKRFTTSFQSMLAKEFPPLLQTPKTWVEFDAAEIVSLMELGGLAASSDESRPVFASMYWEITDQEVCVVSTDGYRLSRKKIINPGWKQASFLAPARTLREVSRIVERAKEPKVWLAVLDSGSLAIKTQSAWFAVRLVEGNFPAYRAIIPADFTTSFSFEREELLSTIKTVLVFSRESSGIVKFKITSNELLLSASSSTLGVSEASLPIQNVVNGENVIAFNGKYVFDVFSNLDVSTIHFQMNESLKPGMFTLDGDDSFLYLVMPFRT